jgi:hypothetical protein
MLKLAFKMEGEKRYDNQQIKITIIMRVSSKFSSQEVINDIETTISPRNLETSAI